MVAIKGDDARQLVVVFERPTEKRFGDCRIPFGAEQEINGLSLFVGGSVKIGPAAFDLDVCFIDAPGRTNFACEAAPAFFEFRA